MRAFVKRHEFFWVETFAAPPPPPSSSYDSFVVDSGCASCEATMVGSDELRATIAGGANDRDSAYGVKDFGGTGGLSGRVYVRTQLRLEPGQTLGANLALFQVRDTSGTLVYELYLSANRTLFLYSPARALRSASINLSTGIQVPNDGSPTRIEVSARANQSVVVRVGGSDRITLSGLTGATSANQDLLRAGIDHYDTSTSSEVVRLYHGAVAWSQAGWLGAAP